LYFALGAELCFKVVYIFTSKACSKSFYNFRLKGTTVDILLDFKHFDILQNYVTPYFEMLNLN
jgi:hypothetical protein